MTDTTGTFPGARRPDRQRTVDSHGLAIAVYEWGDAAAPPILLAHGGFDFAGTFDVFAPMLARFPTTQCSPIWTPEATTAYAPMNAKAPTDASGETTAVLSMKAVG